MSLATRDERLLPRGTRGYGLFTHEDLHHITFYINELASKDVLKNLLSNGEVSLTIARSTDYKALQIKGKYVDHRSTDERDHLLLERHTNLFADNVMKAGGERAPYLHLPYKPSLAITMKIKTIFNQTPGKGSGQEMV